MNLKEKQAVSALNFDFFFAIKRIERWFVEASPRSALFTP
jgi:hypothetical protein